MLLGPRALVRTLSGISKFDYSDNFVSKNSSHADTNIHQLALQKGKL